MNEYWLTTRAMLQPGDGNDLVTKPTLKDKHLQTVPFKFLHDVIVAVLNKTNFAPGLYDENELNKDWEGYDKARVDKDAAAKNKATFLKKVLNVVGIALAEPIQCNVKAVLKGQDPEGANLLLQSLAKAAGMGLGIDGAQAVQRYQAGERMPGEQDTGSTRPASRRASKPIATMPSTEPEAGHDVCLAPPAEEAEMDGPPPSRGRSRRSDGASARGRGTADDDAGLSDAPPADGGDHAEEKRRRKKNSQSRQPAEETADAAAPSVSAFGHGMAPESGADMSSMRHGSFDQPRRGSVDAPDAVAGTSQAEHSGALGSGNQRGDPHMGGMPAPAPSNVEAPATPAQQPQRPPTRPQSAKKAPPKAIEAKPMDKRRSKLRPPDEQGLARPSSRAAVHVYSEAADAENDDDVDIVQEARPRHDRTAGLTEGHGALVSDMYKAKHAADTTAGGAQAGDAGVMVEGGINLGRSKRKARATGPKADLKQLRESIETLVQNITPLARSMDYLQEDRDNMQKELQLWRSEAARWRARLTEEMRHQEDTVAKQSQLDVLKDEVDKKRNSIDQLRKQVLENENEMQRLVSLVVGGV